MRYPRVSVVLGVILFLISASSVAAAENTTTTVEGADIVTTTSSQLVPETSATSAHSFLHMADGNWYDPVSGLTGATQEELLQKISPAIIPVIDPVSSPEETSTSSATTTSPVALDDFPLLKAIRRGKEILLAKATTTVVASDPDWYTVELAIWNAEQDDIQTISLKKKGTDIQLLSPFDGTIRVTAAARLQTQYRVTAASGTASVVAVKYPLYEETKKGKTTRYRREEIVYTPYSLALQTPEMTKWGKEYLDQTLASIYQELQTQKVESAAYPERFVSDVIHPNLPKAVMLIEQSDARTLENQPQESLQHFYTVIAANEDRAYAYLDSPAGANGAAQFMPSTYRLLADQDDFGLNPDFTSGTRSLRNSMKAEVIYLDRLLGAMPDSVQAKHETDPEHAQEYLVAAYNGGEGRVRNAIAKFGDTWLEDRFQTLGGLNKKADVLDVQIASSKKKVKKLQGTALAQEKKKLTSLQSQRNTLSVQINALNKAALRPETLEYLVKYRNAIESLNQEAAAVTVSATTTNTSVSS